jgi:hypothetical protein
MTPSNATPATIRELCRTTVRVQKSKFAMVGNCRMTSVRVAKKDSDGNETHTQVEKVHVMIRDLSKRFDNEYLTSYGCT